MRCPKGHDLGTKWGDRMCTAFTCAEAEPIFKQALSKVLQEEKPERRPQAKIAKRAPDGVEEDLHTSYLNRLQTAGLKVHLQGKDALQWSQEKLTSLLPEAVASLQWDLRYGNGSARREAVQTVLKANGVAQKEAAQGSAPTIVLHLGDSVEAHPFLKRMKAAAAAPAKKAEVVDEED